MLNVFKKNKVVTAFKKLINPGLMVHDKKLLLEYLHDFQKSPSAWTLSDQLLGEQDQQDTFVLFMAAVTLRHKINNSVYELTEQSQEELRSSMLQHLIRIAQSKCADKRCVARTLCVGLADLGLAMDNVENLVGYYIRTLSPVAPYELLHLLMVLPEQAVEVRQESREKLKALRFGTGVLLHYLQDCLHSQSIDLERMCLLTMTAWIRAHLLFVQQIVDHPVIVIAWRLLKFPHKHGGALHEEANECLISFVQHIEWQSINITCSTNRAIEQRVFDNICKLQFVLKDCKPEQHMHLIHLFYQLSKTFGGIYMDQSVEDFEKKGPRGFILLLLAALGCDTNTMHIMIELWTKLVERLLDILQPKIVELYKPLLMGLVFFLIKPCRLSSAYEDNYELGVLRTAVTKLLNYLSAFVPIDLILKKLLQMAIDADSNWRDSEAALFLMYPLIYNLNGQSEHATTMEYVMSSLSRKLNCPSIEETYHVQLVKLLTECHKYCQNTQLLCDFVGQLLHIVHTSKSSSKLCQMASLALGDLYKPNSTEYALVAEQKQNDTHMPLSASNNFSSISNETVFRRDGNFSASPHDGVGNSILPSLIAKRCPSQRRTQTN